MKWCTAALVFVCPIVVVSPVAARELVRHPAAGIELLRPAGWHDATLADVQANRARVRLSDPQLQRALQTRSALPLFVFTKYREPHSGLNPSVQVTLRAALSGASTQLLSSALATMRRAFPDLRILVPVQDTTVGGWPAAHVEATYTLRGQDGGSFPVHSRLWLIPRGSLMFLIGMSGSATGEDGCDQEFGAVLRSIAMDR
jgi:hypothetical protein